MQEPTPCNAEKFRAVAHLVRGELFEEHVQVGGLKDVGSKLNYA